MSEADEVSFREARAEDVPKIVAMLADDPIGAGREGDPHDPFYLDAFARMQAQPGNRMFVALGPRGVLVGCLQMILIPGLAGKGELRAEIAGVRVVHSRRSRGIGARLLAFAEAQARAAGAGRIQLTSNLARPDAHRFWEAQGCVRSHAGFRKPL